jgi:hypothetical protein
MTATKSNVTHTVDAAASDQQVRMGNKSRDDSPGAINSFWLGSIGLATLGLLTIALTSVTLSQFEANIRLPFFHLAPTERGILNAYLSSLGQLLTVQLAVTSVIPILLWRGPLGTRLACAILLLTSTCFTATEAYGSSIRFFRFNFNFVSAAGVLLCWLAVVGAMRFQAIACRPVLRWLISCVLLLLAACISIGSRLSPNHGGLFITAIVLSTVVFLSMLIRSFFQFTTFERSMTIESASPHSISSLMGMMVATAVMLSATTTWFQMAGINFLQYLTPQAIFALAIFSTFNLSVSVFTLGLRPNKALGWILLAALTILTIWAVKESDELSSLFLRGLAQNDEYFSAFWNWKVVFAVAWLVPGTAFGYLCAFWLRFCGWTVSHSRMP